MRTAPAYWTDTVVALDRPRPRPNRPPRREARPAAPTPRTRASHGYDTLPLNDFLQDVHREKCRAERSHTPLSLALFRIDDAAAREADPAGELLDVVHGAKRETDILGLARDDVIAVLCPDTDAAGVQAFTRHIGERAGRLPYSVITATYPDQLFDSLAGVGCTQPPMQLILGAERAATRRGDYAFKRSLDIVLALLSLLLLAPLMLAVAAAVALSSPGPVIFRQSRLGRGGVPFTFYKFRSMASNADDGIHRAFVAELIRAGQDQGPEAPGGSAPYKLQRDPRVTPLGRILRKTSIDELPQLFNVLRGDMSLVGPRPPIPYEAAQYQPWHLRRLLTVRPGITGLWQVEGRSRVSFDEMVRMDLRYVRTCSLGTDLHILLKTVLVVLLCRGAT